jgi:thiamine-phosphate pyrophosphorylase
VAVDFRLYLITDRKRLSIPLVEAVRLALQGGVNAVQVREKDLSTRELLALARELREMTNEYDAKLFINDRVDIAAAVDADGVHLGRRSISANAARSVVGGKMLIGVSTHTLEEAREAERSGADFVTFGPIYATPSKEHCAPVGLEALRDVGRAVTIPIFALGGINGKNLGHVLWAGAYGVGMISAIFGAQDIRKKAMNLSKMIDIVDRAICVQCGRR